MDTSFVQSNLPQRELKTLARVAKQLGKQAVRQHKRGIDLAGQVITAVIEKLGSELRGASGKDWGIGGIPCKPQEGELFRHAVFACEEPEKAADVTPLWPIDVVTVPILRETAPGRFYVGYRTTAKTLGNGENPDERIYSDAIVPIEFGEIICP